MGVKPELLEAARKAGVSEATLDDAAGVTDANSPTEEVDEGSEAPEGAERLEESGNIELSEFPDNWFGINVREYAEEHGVEAAKAHFETLQKQQKAANRRLQQIAERQEAALRAAEEKRAQESVLDEAETDTVDLSELSDEQVLEIAGFDPEILKYDDFGKPLAALARQNLQLQSQLEGIAQESQADKWERQFFGTISELENQHGKIPYSREVIQEYAIERNIYDPEALYKSIMFDVVLDRNKTPQPRKTPAQRRAAATPSRRSSAPNSTRTTLKGASFREHYEAAKKQLGIQGDPFAE